MGEGRVPSKYENTGPETTDSDSGIGTVWHVLKFDLSTTRQHLGKPNVCHKLKDNGTVEVNMHATSAVDMYHLLVLSHISHLQHLTELFITKQSLNIVLNTFFSSCISSCCPTFTFLFDWYSQIYQPLFRICSHFFLKKKLQYLCPFFSILSVSSVVSDRS